MYVYIYIYIYVYIWGYVCIYVYTLYMYIYQEASSPATPESPEAAKIVTPKYDDDDVYLNEAYICIYIYVYICIYINKWSYLIGLIS
jgi:hypothetical protein